MPKSNWRQGTRGSLAHTTGQQKAWLEIDVLRTQLPSTIGMLAMDPPYTQVPHDQIHIIDPGVKVLRGYGVPLPYPNNAVLGRGFLIWPARQLPFHHYDPKKRGGEFFFFSRR